MFGVWRLPHIFIISVRSRLPTHGHNFLPIHQIRRAGGSGIGLAILFGKGIFKREFEMKFIKPTLIIILFGLCLTFAPTSHIKAQESASIQATATVIAGILINGEHDLIFGTVLPGVDKTVDKGDVGFAGAWRIDGDNSAEITLDFTLPDSLMHQDSVAYMPIDFNNTDASYDDGTGGGQTVPVAAINPNGPETLVLGAAGQMDVWIGGTVRPGITQTGGYYAAEVILTVAYTGN